MAQVFPYLFMSCLLLFNFKGSLHAEIQSVKLTWTAALCQASCQQQLEKEFRKIAGVENVIMDGPNGQAELIWRQGIPFSYTAVKTAMQMIGLYIRSIRVKVHGTLQHTPQNVTLVSKGDNSRFDIINPVIPNPQGQTVQYNLAARALTPELRKKFLDAESLKQEVTIEGPLFMPHRSPPLQIVPDQTSFISAEDLKKADTTKKKK